jgi:hypothetical protein
MRKMLVATAAIVAFSALVALDAGAMPLAPDLGLASGDTTLVRDGCGRGMRFSERRGRCVPDEDRGEVAVCPRGFRWSDGRQRCVPEVRVREECPPGFRFSESRQSCVPRF